MDKIIIKCSKLGRVEHTQFTTKCTSTAIALKPFYSKLAGSLARLVTLFVKHFHYLECTLLHSNRLRWDEESGDWVGNERTKNWKTQQNIMYIKTGYNWLYIESRKHNLMYSSTNYSQSNYISVTFLHLILEALFNNIKSMEKL